MRRSVLLPRLPALLVALVLLVVPASAVAQTVAPPGISGSDQYRETIPGATGDESGTAPSSGSNGSGSGTAPSSGSNGSGSGTAPSSGSTARGSETLPPRTAGELDGSAAGRRAAALAAATSPRDDRSGRERRSEQLVVGERRLSNDFRPRVEGSTSAGRSVLEAVTGTSSGGMGVLLPILLVLAVLAGLFLFLLRRRRSTS